MIIYTVRFNGKPIKNFVDKTEANNFMKWLITQDQLETARENLIEEALAKSDLSEANQIIKFIMEKK